MADAGECRRFHRFSSRLPPSSDHPPFPWALVNRFLQLAARASLSTAALLAIATASPLARAHVGHGDQFSGGRDVRQVKRDADSDGLLGVATAKPEQGPDGLTVPATALVDADGESLLFVQTEKTLRPQSRPDRSQPGRNQWCVTEGIDPTDDVRAVGGALRSTPRSKKTQQVEAPAARCRCCCQGRGRFQLQRQPAVDALAQPVLPRMVTRGVLIQPPRQAGRMIEELLNTTLRFFDRRRSLIVAAAVVISLCGLFAVAVPLDVFPPLCAAAGGCTDEPLMAPLA